MQYDPKIILHFFNSTISFQEQSTFRQKQPELKNPSLSQAHTRPQTSNKSAVSISSTTLSPSDPSDKPQITAKPYIPLRSSAPLASSSSVTFGAGRSALPVVTLSSPMVPNSAAFPAATNHHAPSSVPGTFVVSNSVSLPVVSTHASAAAAPALSMPNKPTLTIRPPLSPKPESTLRIAPEPVNPAQTKISATASQASPVSRPLSAPGVPLPAMRPSAPTGTPVQVSPYLSRSVSLSGRVGNTPDMASSTSAPSFFPQSYRNAITGSNNITLAGSSPNFNPVGFTPQSSQSFTQGAKSTNSITAQSNSTFGHQSSSFGQIGLDASTSGTFQSNPSFFSSTASFEPISWKHNMDELTNDESLGQAGSSGSYQPTGPSCSYQQDTDTSWPYPLLGPNGSEDPRDPPNWRTKIADEFPHMDIINDLLEEPTRLPKFTFPSWWMPIPGVSPQPNTGSTSGSSLFDLPEQYNSGFARPAYGSNVREGQSLNFSNAPFNNAPYYANGQNDGLSQKRWGYDYTTDLSMNMGVDMNGFSHGSGDYTYLPGGLNRFRYPHDSGH